MKQKIKIKAGQVWKKIDTGRVVKLNRKTSKGWQGNFIEKNSNKMTHNFNEFTLLRYYQLIS